MSPKIILSLIKGGKKLTAIKPNQTKPYINQILFDHDVGGNYFHYNLVGRIHHGGGVALS